MAEPFFIWNDVDSRTMGVIVTDIPPAIYPAERVEEIVVPGRSGTLLRDEGEDVYDSYVLTIGIANRAAVPYWQIAAWLRGSGRLILSTEPNRVYEARILKQASASHAFRNNYNGGVGFSVQPLKAAFPADPPVTLGDAPEGTADVVHQGDVPARPVYTLEGTGLLELTVGDASEGGAGSLIAVDVGEGDGCIIDTDAGTVTNLQGTESLTASTELYYNGFRGLWLPVGVTTTVAWGENVESVTMDPRWRWL